MGSGAIKILVVDDDLALLAVLEAGLRTQPDYEITAMTSASEAIALVGSRDFDLVITDYSLGDRNITGLTMLRAVREKSDKTLVIIITAFASLEITLESIHLGAYDFLTKPFQLDELLLVARNAAERIQLERENTALRQEVAGLIQALDEVQAQQGELMERLRHLNEEGGAEPPGGGGLPTALAGASLMELRRRRMREQLAAYVRTGETIRDRLNRERENIEVLFKKGVLSEQAYRRAIMERKTGS